MDDCMHVCPFVRALDGRALLFKQKNRVRVMGANIATLAQRAGIGRNGDPFSI